MEEKRNSGILILSKAERPPGLIIVTGTGRCGSTCVASLLLALGVNLCRTENGAGGLEFSESFRLNDYLKNRNGEGLSTIAAEMGDAVWAFKTPGEFAHIAFAANHLKHLNPHIICVCRDSVASACCEINFQSRINCNIDQAEWLRTFAGRNMRMLAEVSAYAASAPTMFVSFEKLLENKSDVTKGICEFAGIEFSESALTAIGRNKSYYRCFS